MVNDLLLSTAEIVGITVGSVAGFVLLVLIAIAIWYIHAYNNFKRRANLTDEAWSTIEVSLKKRYDLIPNLVETVKGYAAHEKETLTAVIDARNAAVSAQGAAKAEAENVLTGTLRSLFALQESYPALKADAAFSDLRGRLASVENELAAARRYYNATVREFNTMIDVFPSNLVARRMRLAKRDLFEIADPAERENVQVRF